MLEMTDGGDQLTLERAQSAVLSHDYAVAARLYRGLLREDPANVGLLAALGNVYQRSGDDEQAVPLYRQIVGLDQRNVEALNSLGSIYRRQKKYAEAIAALEQAAIADGENVQTFYNLGFTYKLMGKHRDAISCFNTVVDKNPEDVLAYNHIGSIYAQEGEHEKAVASYQRGLKVDPNHPVLHLNLAKSYEKLGSMDKASSEYEAALRSKPGWLEAIDGYADLLMDRNQPKNASALLGQAVRLNPRDASVHTKIGHAYTRQCLYEIAEGEFSTALKLEPENTGVLSALASVYEEDGKNAEALRTMKRYEELAPDDSDMLRQYAGILLSADEVGSAGRKIKRVWDKDPDDVQTLSLLGQYYICRGDEAKAEGCFQRIKDVDPAYTDYYRDGARRYSQRGQFDKAELHLKKYLETNPSDFRATAMLAAAYEKQDRFAAALDVYRRLSAEDEDNVLYRRAVERNGKLAAVAAPAPEAAEPFSDAPEPPPVIDTDIAPVVDAVEDFPGMAELERDDSASLVAGLDDDLAARPASVPALDDLAEELTGGEGSVDGAAPAAGADGGQAAAGAATDEVQADGAGQEGAAGGGALPAPAGAFPARQPDAPAESTAPAGTDDGGEPAGADGLGDDFAAAEEDFANCEVFDDDVAEDAGDVAAPPAAERTEGETDSPFASSAALFEVLRGLCEFLPTDKKLQFLQSREHLQMEYAVRRLSGTPGLRERAESVCGRLRVAPPPAAAASGRALALAVLDAMRPLIRELPDASLAASLDEEVQGVVSKLSA